MKHKHNWRISSWGLQRISYLCSCGERKERIPTDEEKAEIEESFSTWTSEVPWENVHHVYHEFVRKFYAYETIDRGWVIPGTKKTAKWKIRAGYKLSGYALMKAVGKWAEAWPEDVFSAGVDDSSHMGSDLFFIAHRTATNYFGTTVIYIPQDGNTTTEFFMYPGHREEIMETLLRVKALEKTTNKAFREHRKLHPRNPKKPWLSSH